jgi:phytol kinase
MRKEVVRKVLHTILAISFAGSAPYLSKEFLLTGAFLLFGLFAGMRIARVYTHVHKISRVSFGELFLPLGIVGALLLSWPDIMLFQVAMLVLAIADPLAALIGMRFGKHPYKIYDEQRSFEGSATCAVALFCIFIVFGTPLYAVSILVVALTVVEAVSLRGSDNLFLPTATVLLFQLLM